MIELFSCAPLSAAITQKQCAINRESIISCRGCAGLGELVESVGGVECQKSIPRWNRPLKNYSLRERAPQSGHEALVSEDISLDLVDRRLSVCFDLTDPDDIALLKKIEAVACEHGLTLGDEIMVRLHVLQEAL